MSGILPMAWDWHELPGTPWPPRHAASVFIHQNALWVVAGNNMTSDVWKTCAHYDQVTNGKSRLSN